MQNFTFYNPTRIVFGKDQLSELDNLIPKSDKVMILYGGGSVKKNGTLDKVINELHRSSRSIIEFPGIEPNPRFETLMKAVEIVRSEKVDFLLAVGGGSVMDGSKFVALASLCHIYFGKEEELLKFGFGHAPVDKALPLACIPTLPATGSEMNCGGVISMGTHKFVVMNPLLYPKFSILDPSLTFSLPPKQIANGII
ncbi:MAG: iron-containing alcohol dehydrogenase, partial [Lentisphaeria bacterium]